MPYVKWKVREWNHRLLISLTDHPSDSIVDCLLFHTSTPGVYTLRCGRLFHTFPACDLESAKKIAMYVLQEWLQEAVNGLDKVIFSHKHGKKNPEAVSAQGSAEETTEPTISAKLPRGGWF